MLTFVPCKGPTERFLRVPKNSLRQYTESTNSLKTNVYAYDFVVLAFLLGTLVHNTTLMSKPHLQVCKQ